VHRIIERHGGEVGVRENPGGGSRFWFTVPATPPDGQSTASAERTGAAR
jgi:signal transduction histidine kinase